MMTHKQLKQAHVLRNYIEGEISRREAANKLGLSERQISRKAKALKELGEESLIHKNTGRKPAHALTDLQKAEIIRLWQDPIYAGCNFNHFRELLAQRHLIFLSYNPLYRLLMAEGLKSPKQHRKRIKHRRRKRKSHAGALLQIDASPFDWLGNGRSYALHAAIDDATGVVTGMYLCEHECLHGYFEVMRSTLLNYGVPLSVYSDKHTIFRSPKTDKLAEIGEEANLTQFGRALAELGVNLIHAHSPQAKGRVERLWGTLQSRLHIELRIRKIFTLEEANAFLSQQFRQIFEHRFAVPATDKSIFVPYTHPVDLDDILCVKDVRKLDNAGVFTYKGRHFKVLDQDYPLLPPRAKVTVFVGMNSAVRVQYQDRFFPVQAYIPIKSAKKPAAHVHSLTKDHLHHGSRQWKAVWHSEDYSDSLAFLADLFLEDSSLPGLRKG